MLILNIIFVIVGVAIVLWGADRMTDGAVALAQRMSIPAMVIGLTVVAMGTSMPELSVSLVSALKGTPDLAMGNVVGSNIMNTLLIVGVAAVVAPLLIARGTVKKDIPFTVLGTVILLLIYLDGTISRLDALLLFVLFISYIGYTLWYARRHGSSDSGGGEEEKKDYSVGKSLFFIVLGLICLVGGSTLFVDGATYIAEQLNVSQAVIGLTIVAGGTSLPELATSVVAAKKGQSEIAIGNVIGSNVFNIFMILGITGLICPMTPMGINTTDLALMLVSIILMWLFSFTKYKIERWEGALLTLIYIAYVVYRIIES